MNSIRRGIDCKPVTAGLRTFIHSPSSENTTTFPTHKLLHLLGTSSQQVQQTHQITMMLYNKLFTAASLGVATHLQFFIHGELDQYVARIIGIHLALYSLRFTQSLFQKANSLQAIIATSSITATYFLFLGGSIVIYRLFFHRTRRFPGSVTDAVSKRSAALKAADTDQYHHMLTALHQKYGDFVRIGKILIPISGQSLISTELNELSINNTDACKALHGSATLCTKGSWYSLGGVGRNLQRT